MPRPRKVRVGRRYRMWHKPRVLLEIRPYTGRFTQWFDAVLVFLAPECTIHGVTEIAVRLADWPRQEYRS